MEGLGSRMSDAIRARQGETIAPAFRKDAFHCLHCSVLAPQRWERLMYAGGAMVGATIVGSGNLNSPVWSCECSNCDLCSFWYEHSHDLAKSILLLPHGGSEPMPHAAMPSEVKEDSLEARAIAGQSPRGASALVRL